MGEWTKNLIRMLQPENILGLAIGNELELLADKSKTEIPHSCVVELWDKGRLWKTFDRFVTEFDAMGDEYKNVPVTSVFTGTITEGNPFMNIRGRATVQEFLLQATRKYYTRYVFT